MVANFLKDLGLKMKVSSFARQLRGQQREIYSLDIYSEESYLERKLAI